MCQQRAKMTLENLNPVSQPVHLLTHIVRFSSVLHQAGIAVNVANLIDLCRCFWHIDINNRQNFYAAARTTLISSHDELEPFDKAFNEFWNQSVYALANVLPEDEHKQAVSTPQSTGNNTEWMEDIDTGDEGDDRQSLQTGYSPDELLMKKDLGDMTEEEIEKARRLIADIVAIIANYQSRRRVSSNNGREMDFRRMLRRNALQGWDGVELLYRKRRIKKTRLMLLYDVSGSMERYSHFLIQFICALQRELSDVEMAVFSTRMTVITPLLESGNIEEMLHQFSTQVHDWVGGTDIGRCVREFNDHFAHDMLRSRTIMIILSDGWDRGDAWLMHEEMSHLRRRVYKLLWLNPLLGSSDYQPICRGMQIALPYLDYFLSAHNLESLAQLAKTLRSIWR